MPERIAFITGGNRGLGFQTALELKDAAKVVIGSRDLVRGQEAVQKLRAAGADVDMLQFDVNEPASHQAVYQYFKSHYGRLDILVNNAAIAGGSFPADASPEHTVLEVPMALLRKVFETNFFAQVALTQTLLPLIRKSPAGRIVNVSSIVGSLTLQGDPKSPLYHAKSFAYDASKAALNAFTIHLAYELRDTGIKVNSAHPGWVKTDMGGPRASMDVADGGKASAALATLPEDGPSGGFFHLAEEIPW